MKKYEYRFYKDLIDAGVVLGIVIILVLLSSCGRVGEEDKVEPKTGPKGQDGTSCSVSQEGTVSCGSSTYVLPEARQGVDGQAGASGASCVVSTAGLVTCGASTYQIPTPERGEIGPAGAQGYPGVAGSTVSAIVPCPTLISPYPEVLMCVDQKLYALFVGGTSVNQIRYVEVVSGSYISTDGRSCTFTVTTGCNIQ